MAACPDGRSVGHVGQMSRLTDLGGFLQMASVVLLDVVPGADGCLQLVPDHHARTLGGGPAGEQHHAGTRVGERALKRGTEQLRFRLRQLNNEHSTWHMEHKIFYFYKTAQ